MPLLSRRAWLCCALVLLAVAVLGATTAGADEGRGATTCAPIASEPGYAEGIYAALQERRDVWGEELLSSPQGPTYDAVHGRLHPLMLVGKPAGLGPKRLTDSGVYYLPFGQPRSPAGANAVELHVADGGQIASEMVNGPRLTLFVGRGGTERYGSCLSRLATPELGEGYLPILETSYVDAEGTRYRQESFATRIPEIRALVSFVRLSVDPTASRRGTVSLRFAPSKRLHRVGAQLRQGRGARLLFSRGGQFVGGSLVYTTRRPRTVYVAWLNQPARTRAFRLDKAAYERARASVATYWSGRLAAGAEIVVPEQRVYDAERNLLIQNMLLSWRYSLGNFYERFSWELMDVAETMGSYGFRGVQRAILEAALKSSAYFPNRAAGERMTATADYLRRYRDDAFLDRVSHTFRATVQSFDRQLERGKVGLLRRERYGADIVPPVYGLHAQVLALQGLRAMAGIWAASRHAQLAFDAIRVADRLEQGLRAAVAAAQTTLPDGSLFVPVALVDGREGPYDSLTSSKRGSYWNLVMPYVLASGFFRPGSPEATGLLRYLLWHGSRFLGLVRFSPHTGVANPGYETPGTDDVYGTNVARFLADNDQPDQLLLSLYGKLGAGMTENTFVSGEGATIAPVGTDYYRTMHRPPNSANNGFFLETLRLLLVHETTDASGLPTGLELAYATPRAWLENGKRIEVKRVQTAFGPVSYSLEARRDSVRVSLDVPPDLSGPLRLRLRLPHGERILSHLARRADPETLDLTGRTGHVELVVPYESD
jgi:hypothetical protein